MKALILSGGRGTRLRPLTHTSNKQAIPIANQPLVLYPFLNIVNSGITEIAIIVNDTAQDIKKIIGDGSKWGVNVTYIYQENPEGLAHALSLSENFMGDSKFVMALGDNMIQEPLGKFIDHFENSDLNAMVLGISVPVEEHSRLGMATLDETSGNVLRYIEKPGKVDMSELYDPENSFAVTGYYFFDMNVFACFKGKGKIVPSSRGELEIASPYNWLIEHGFKVGLQKVTGWWKDPGDPTGIFEANKLVMDWKKGYKNSAAKVENSEISDKVEIGEGSEIINSQISGPVIIGKNVRIENSEIGPYTAIADDSQLNSCRIQNSILLGGVVVNNLDRTISNSLIGWNANVSQSEKQDNSVHLFIGDDSVVEV